MRLSFWLGCALFAFPSISSAGQVVIVSGPATGTYADVQSAVNAAHEADVLLVGPGVYPAFTVDGKGVAIFAQSSGAVFVGQPVEIRNLPPTSTVVLHGLLASFAGAPGSNGIELSGNAGHVRLQSCQFQGKSMFGSGGFSGGDGIHVDSSARVTIARCTTTGGIGKFGGTFYLGGEGGCGIDIDNSSVAVFDVVATGGKGGGGSGGDGGDGLRLRSGVVFAAGNVLQGGPGGDAQSAAFCGGKGGNGAWIWAGDAQVLDNDYHRGGPGWGPYACPGQYGATLLSTGNLVQHDGVAREMLSPAIVSDGAAYDLTVEGADGDVAWLRPHRRATWIASSSTVGPWLVPLAPQAQLVPLGLLPQNGPASVLARPVTPGQIVRVEYQQLVVEDTHGTRYLGTPWHVLVFDDAAGPDCNGNHVPDALDIATGTSIDVDHDGVPDECP